MSEEINQQLEEESQSSELYMFLTWLTQTFQKEGERFTRSARDETFPSSYLNQLYGHATLYLAWAFQFGMWKNQARMGKPPDQTDSLVQLHRMMVDQRAGNGK